MQIEKMIFDLHLWARVVPYVYANSTFNTDT
ncbi:Unannotated [Lentimonas sp. CC4]|nr:Unannotated [Lentimonas sp. CC4]CAA7182153.1 Unannotated [Lentimonas sp. CC8]